MGTGNTKTKKPSKKISRILWIILVTLFCWAIWKSFLQDIVPWERTIFLNYQSFREKTGFVVNNYPPELPSGAEDTRYYCGRSWIVKKTGMSFMVSGDEYQELKETYLSLYKEKKEKALRESRESGEDYQERCRDWATVGGTIYEFNVRVIPEIFKEGELDYLEKISRNKIEDYTLLADEKLNGREDTYYLNGILFNDDTHEFVFFAFQTVDRKACE